MTKLNKRHRLNLVWALSLFISSAIMPALMATHAYGEDIVVVLDATTAYVDTVVVVDTTTAYVITTTTGPRTEVVDSITVERVAWVDSWIILYRGGVADTRTVISQDDDSNSTTNNFWASKLSGIATPDTYTIRATSYEYAVAGQRPIGTYTLSSNLIPPQVDTATAVVDTGTAVVETNTVVVITPPVIDTPVVVVQPVITQPIVDVPSPVGIIDLPTLDQSPPIEISLPTEEPLVIDPILEEQPFVDPLDNEIPIQQEIDNQVLENPSIESFTTSEILENISQDLDITPADAEAVIDSLMEDGLVTQAEATELIETLTDSGVLSQSEENLILEVLSADGEITQEEVNNLSETLSKDGQFTTAERELVAEALIESAEGSAVTVEAIAEAGIALADLPPATPVELRQDENGNDVIITAVIADALQLLESPAAILEAIFESPAQLIFALGNLGADMSEGEREEATKTIVAATIVGNIAANAAVTASMGAVGYRRKP